MKQQRAWWADRAVRRSANLTDFVRRHHLEQPSQRRNFPRSAKRRTGIVSRGLYAWQLEDIYRVFDKRQVRVEFYETLKRSNDGYDGIFAFLGVAPFARRLSTGTRVHARAYEAVSALEAETECALHAFYAPFNARLFELVGADQATRDAWAHPACGVK